MNETQDVVIELSEPQTAVLSARTPLVLDMAGQGSGKSQNIGYHSGMMLQDFPQLLGFIGANTLLQLSQSTLARVFKTWADAYGLTEFDQKANPAGAFVVDKRPPPHFKRFHRLRDYNGTISFYSGALVFLGSLDNYKAHEGKEFAWAHLDETKDTKEDALKDVILGRLRQYGLWFNQAGDLQYNPDITQASQLMDEGWTAWNPLFIHTSPATGGVPWLNEMFKLGKFEKEIKKEVLKKDRGFFHKVIDGKTIVIYSTHHNQPNLPPNYIANRSATLSAEKIMLNVYAYPFAKSGGEYFPEFHRDKHVREVKHTPGLPVHQSWDFNVVPYMTLICAQVKFLNRYVDAVGVKWDNPEPGFTMLEVMRISVYKEYCLESPRNTTDAVCEAFAQDHPVEETEVYYYGDSSGLNRIPGLGSLTNFKIIEDALFAYMHNNSKQVKNPNVTPLKRRDLLNDIFSGRLPAVEIEVDTDCIELIDDLENVKLGIKGKVKKREKDAATGGTFEKYGHASDALECFVSEICKPYIS